MAKESEEEEGNRIAVSQENAMRLAKLVVGVVLFVSFTSSCSIVSQTAEAKLTIDVPAVTLKSNYSLNGEPFPESQYDRAFFFLRNPESSDTVELGSSSDQSHNTVIIPGVYDAMYAHTQGSDVPQNEDTVAVPTVTIQTDQDLDIDVSAIEISPHFTLNGKPFSTSVYDSAEFYLEDVSGGERIPLGNSHQASGPILILPGSYNVIYSHQSGSGVPQNQDAIVEAAVSIDADQVLEIDVPAVTLTSSYTMNGEPFSVSQYTTALFSFRDPETGDTIDLGYSHEQSHSTMIISGVYDVVYAHAQGSAIPQNQNAVVMSDVDISSRRALPIDVPTVTLRSTYSLNGEPFPESQYTRALFSLRNPDSGDTVALGDSSDQSHNTVIIPGVYNVVYAHTQGTEIPQNQDAVVMNDVDISSSRALAVDVSAVTLTSSYAMNGDPFAESQYTRAFFSLRDPDSGDSVALGDSSDQSHSTVIIPGVYDVVYAHTQGTEIPQNQNAIVMSDVDIGSSQALTIDVPAITLVSSYTMNGEPFSESQYVRAFFSLRNPDSGDTVELGWCYDQSHSTVIIPGAYDVVYAHTQGTEIPQNKDAIVMSDVDIDSG